MNNSRVTIVVSQITAVSSHLVAGLDEGEHQSHGHETEEEQSREPSREVHESPPVGSGERAKQRPCHNGSSCPKARADWHLRSGGRAPDNQSLLHNARPCVQIARRALVRTADWLP